MVALEKASKWFSNIFRGFNVCVFVVLSADDWCFIKERASSSSPQWTTLFWSIVSFYGWIFLSVFIYMILVVLTMSHVISMRQSLRTDSLTLNKLSTSLVKLIWYPLITIIVWLPAAIYDFTEYNKAINDRPSKSDDFSQYIAYLLPATHGFLIAIVFIATNIDVRLVLLEMCRGRGMPSPQLLENILCQVENSSSASADSRSVDKSPSKAAAMIQRDMSSRNSSSPSTSFSTTAGSTIPAYVAPSVIAGGKPFLSKGAPKSKSGAAANNPLGWTADDADEDSSIDYNYV